MKGVENVETKELENGMVEISGSIPWETFASYEKSALARLSKHLEVDGFRKGFVPEATAKKHLGDELILSDMAELAIAACYPFLLEEKNIDAIGRPSLTIKKLARDNEFSFSITTAVLPTIKLPDYKKLAKEIPLGTVSPAEESEVNKVIEDLRQMRAYGHVHGEHDAHEHTEELPEVNDEFAKSFGDFKNLDELKAKIKENIEKEKTLAEKDKRRVAIMDTLIKETTFAVPALILESEQEKMLAQIEADIARAGMTFDAYLTQVQKTREDLKTEYKDEAERRARFQMLINAIANDMQIKTTDEEVVEEAKKLMAIYPDADENRAKAYADMVLTNEKVLSALEEK